VQWKIVYLLSIAISTDDDTCESLIVALKEVLDTCGVQFHQPASLPSTRNSFINFEDFENHEERVWSDIRSKARSIFSLSVPVFVPNFVAMATGVDQV